MPDASAPCPHSALALVLRPRFVGVATVCRDGLPSRGFQCWNLRRFQTEAARQVAFERLLLARMESSPPAVLVLAHEPQPPPRVRAFAASAGRHAAMRAISVQQRSSRDAARVALGRYPAAHRDDLPKALAGVFPTLARHVGARGDRERYLSPAWRALALALDALDARCPACATAARRAEATPPL